MSDSEDGEKDRFPVEVADALDVLGKRQNRRLLGQLWDTDLYETAHSDEDVERLDSLKTAGLATKQIHQQTADGFNSVYRLSEYGERFISSLVGTLTLPATDVDADKDRCPGCGHEGDGDEVLAGGQRWCPDTDCRVVSFRTTASPNVEYYATDDGYVRECPECGGEPDSVDTDGPLRSCSDCQIVYHQDGTVVA